MDVVDLPLEQIIPYARNPRPNAPCVRFKGNATAGESAAKLNA